MMKDPGVICEYIGIYATACGYIYPYAGAGTGPGGKNGGPGRGWAGKKKWSGKLEPWSNVYSGDGTP